MQVTSHKAPTNPAVVVIDVEGELSDEHAEALSTELHKQMRLGRTKIVLNFEKTSFLTTRGVAECAAAAKRVRDRGGDLKIANARGDVWRVIEMVWLHRMITCYGSVNEAVREF